MRSSAIRNILSLAVRPDIISFAGGMPGDELFPTNDLRELVATLTEKQVQEAMQYGPTSGYPPLLEALKEWLRAKGFPVDTNRLIITTGSLQAINIIGKIFINPGDVVLTEDPVFIGATSAFKSFEAELKGVPMDADGIDIATIQPDFDFEIEGVNDRGQLANLERIYQSHLVENLQVHGVQFADPSRVDIRGTLTCGQDVFIDVNVVFEGAVTLGDSVYIEAGCVIRDSQIGNASHIKPYCVIDQSQIGAGVDIGPFAHLRPATVLSDNAKVGNFVETKKSTIGKGSKVNHLTYIGDAQIGDNVNVGAGTITCNYDGVNKFKTVIEDNAFIGSNSSLVAPVTIGKGATIGAGSVITKAAPEEKLTVTRAKQTTIDSWQRPVKK